MLSSSRTSGAVVPPSFNPSDGIPIDDAPCRDMVSQTFSAGIRFLLRRRLGNGYTEEAFDDVIATVIQSTHGADPPEPEELARLVLAAVRRQQPSYPMPVATRHGLGISRRKDSACSMRGDCEHKAVERESWSLPCAAESSSACASLGIALRIIEETPKRHRKALALFYAGEVPAGEVCQKTGLTETQFLSIKDRARARFSEVQSQFRARSPRLMA
jgi:DNA-directed RNA polymerase specialized sigma24 family protein